MVADELVRLASEIAALYEDVGSPRMTLITGSAARGLADDASDLDIYLYRDDIDPDQLSRAPDRLVVLGASRVFGIPTADGFFEKYQRAGRYVEIECVRLDALERAARAIADGRALTGAVTKTAVGMRDAVPVVGADELRRWQARLTFTDAVAIAEVVARGPRLLAPSALFELTDARGDPLSFAARLSQVLLNVVALLGAANRAFQHASRQVCRHPPPRPLIRSDALTADL